MDGSIPEAEYERFFRDARPTFWDRPIYSVETAKRPRTLSRRPSCERGRTGNVSAISTIRKPGRATFCTILPSASGVVGDYNCRGACRLPPQVPKVPVSVTWKWPQR